jgi:hypothetical protein
MPKLAAGSEAVFSSITRLLPSTGSGGANSAKLARLEADRRRKEAEYGLPVELQKELPDVAFNATLKENLVGADSEALYCVRKGPVGFWGECDDYVLFVKKLAELERSRRGDRGGGADNTSSRKLRVNAYFAETDDMIGKKGQAYMEDCWKGSEEVEFQDILDFTTRTVSETDHDSVLVSVEVLEQIFLSAGGTKPGQ